MYIIKMKDGRRWKVREAVSLNDACNAITSARVSGSIGSKSTHRDIAGNSSTLADVIQINSDGTERQPYSAAY